MSPLLKKALTVAAIKKGYDKVQEVRAPRKRSFLSRFGPKLLIAGAGAGVVYLVKSGKLPGRSSTTYSTPSYATTPVSTSTASGSTPSSTVSGTSSGSVSDDDRVGSSS